MVLSCCFTTSLKYTVLIPGWKICVQQQQCPTTINVIDSLLIHFFTLALLVSICNIVLSIFLSVTNNFPRLIVSFVFAPFPEVQREEDRKQKELPGGSPSVHISVGARQNKRALRERRRERKRKEKRSRVCSWQLFQQPISLAVISFLRYHFDESVPIFNLMWEVTAVWGEKTKKVNIITSKSVLFLFHSQFLRSFSFSFFFFTLDFFLAVSSRSFHSPIYRRTPSFLPFSYLARTWQPGNPPQAPETGSYSLCVCVFGELCDHSLSTTQPSSHLSLN